MSGEACSRRPPAFTLLETVIALGLGVLLVAAVQSLVLHAYRAAATLEEQEHAAARTRLPFELLEQDLSGIVGQVTLADGELAFTTTNALESERPVVRHAVVVRYQTKSVSDDALCLTRQERELGVDEETNPLGGAVLASGLAAVQLAVGDGQGWHTAWPKPVPRAAWALRMTLTWPDGRTQERTFRLAPWHWRGHDD
jgi:type II secretory pathway component PulJ